MVISITNCYIRVYFTTGIGFASVAELELLSSDAAAAASAAVGNDDMATFRHAGDAHLPASVVDLLHIQPPHAHTSRDSD